MVENLRHIRAFIAVARSGNFTRAAAVLHISQSALTVQIQQLEASLGVKILDRDKRNCRLTPEGMRLVAPMEQLLLNAEALSGVALGDGAALSGFVTVASMPSAGAHLLPQAIASFYEKFPHARVRVRDAPSQDVVSLVISGDADFGIAGYAGMHRDLLFLHLRNGRICAFVNRDHALAKQKKVTLKTLCEFPLILTEKSGSLRNTFESAAEKAQLSLHLAFEVNQISTALGLASAGLGVAILNESALAHNQSENLVRIEISGPAISRPIHLVRRKDKPLSPTAEALLQELRDLKEQDEAI
jgi:DNA-binding transcriptional LysR family regulator